MANAEQVEEARVKAAKAQAAADRERELKRREAREKLAQSQSSLIDHGQARK